MFRPSFIFCLLTILISVSVCPAFASDAPQTPKQSREQPHYGDTSLKHFPVQFGKNVTGLFSRQNIWLGIEAGIATELSRSLWDYELPEFFGPKQRIDKVNDFGNFLGGSLVTGGATGALFLMGRFTDDAKFRAMSYSMAQAFLLNGVLTTGIKYAVGRVRPDRSNRLSFLSGHTSSAFTMATVLNHYYGWKVGIPAYVASAVVGTARIGSNVHYLSDVTAGAFLGIIVGKTVVRNDGYQSKFMLAPVFAPSAKEFGLNLTIRF